MKVSSNYTKIPNSMVRAGKELSAMEFRVWAVMMSYRSMDQRFVDNQMLADDAGIAVRTLCKTKRSLKDKGLLESTRNPDAVVKFDPRWPEYTLAQLPYRDYLKTEHWKDTRLRALKHYGFSCCLCGATTELNVHHRHYDTIAQEKNKDLIVLCQPCHKKHHGIGDHE